MANNTYSVDEEDGLFYVFDPQGKAVASYCDEKEAQRGADKLNAQVEQVKAEIRAKLTKPFRMRKL